MRRRVGEVFLVLFVLAAGACGGGEEERDDDTGPPVMDGYAGGADYFFDNETDTPVVVEWTPNGAPGGDRSPLNVGATDSSLLFQDAILGAIPYPTDSLRSLTVRVGERTVYRQQPVQDSQWQTDSTGEYSRTHTLRFTDELVGTDTALPEGSCCCEFLIEGDITEEDLRTRAECSAEL